MVQHEFKVQTNWNGGRDTVGNLQGDILEEQISIPSGLGGNGTGTHPDELLVSAASSCYIISLDTKIAQSSIGTAIFENAKFRMDNIVHYPEIYVSQEQKDNLTKKLPKLLKVADNNCMISNSLRGNVEVKIVPKIK